MVSIASEDYLCEWSALGNEPGTSIFAVFDTRNAHPVLNFDPTTAWNGQFSGVLPANYAGGGVTVDLHWMAATATAGTVVWSTAFERVGTVLDIDADSFAAANSGTTVTQGTAGLLNVTSIAHTSGAQMDSLAANEGFRLQVTRAVADAQDAMGGTAQLRWVALKET